MKLLTLPFAQVDVWSPFRLNDEGERVTIDPADFYKIFYGKRCNTDDSEAIRYHLARCLPAPFTPGKAKKRNKAKRSPAAGGSVTSSPAALVVQSSDEEGEEGELPIAVAIRLDDGVKDSSA